MRRSGWRKVAALALLLHLALCAVSVWSVADADLESMDIMYVSNMASDLVALITCSCIFSSILLDRRITRNTHIFMTMLTFEAILLALDIQNWIINGDPDLVWANELVNYCIYLMMYVLIGSFWWYVSDSFPPDHRFVRMVRRLVVLLLAAGSALVISNYWNGMFFTVGEDGWYSRSDLFIVSMICPTAISLITMATVIRCGESLRMKLVFVSYVLIPYIAALIQMEVYGISLQYISFMLALMLIYANIYVSRSAELILSETEMMEQRAEAAISQIQPHFLYNVLTSIMNIKGSSEESKDAIVSFSRYLRFNLDSTKATYPIPISAELDHLETYISLRKLHYGDRLELDTDIGDKNIHLPPQSLKVIVQSLMESDIDDTDLMMITLVTKQVGRDHVITIGYGGPSAKMENYTESESYRSLKPTIDRLRRSVGCRFSYRYEPDDYAEVEMIIPVDAKVRK